MHTGTRLDRVIDSPLIPQLDQLLDGLIERHNLATLLGSLVIAVPPVDGAVLLLLSTDDHDVVVQSQLRSADLLLHGVSADVDVGVDVLLAERGLDLLDVVVGAGHDGNDHDLARRQPEWPATGEVLGEDAAGC